MYAFSRFDRPAIYNVISICLLPKMNVKKIKNNYKNILVAKTKICQFHILPEIGLKKQKSVYYTKGRKIRI